MHTWVKNDSFLLHSKREKMELTVEGMLTVVLNLKMTFFLIQILKNKIIHTHAHTYTQTCIMEGGRERGRGERVKKRDWFLGEVLPKIVVIIRTIYKYFFQVTHGYMTCIGQWNVNIQVGVTSRQTLEDSGLSARFLPFPCLSENGSVYWDGSYTSQRSSVTLLSSTPWRAMWVPCSDNEKETLCMY